MRGVQQFLAQFSTIPLYNTKAVAQETGVPADTFRAWERRYGIPRPHRTEGGHRLYSEREIAIIRWLRDRTAEGMTISQAIALMSRGEETSNRDWFRSAVDTEPHSWDRLVARFVAALTSFDNRRAEYILGEAFALYALDDVLFHLIEPAMRAVGDLFHEHKITVTAEHFASQFVRRKLFSLLNTYALSDARASVVVGCAPGELHELGVLLLSLVLVRHGWHVIYLGPQVPMPDLLDTVHRLRPDVVCLSASQAETARELIAIGRALRDMSPPAPRFCFGGRAFNLLPHLRETVPGIFLGSNARQAAEKLALLFHEPLPT